MLRTLHIENIAVIKCVDIAFDEGLTVLTGETGAGKSILIDSLGLLLGGKFSREIIRTGESTATVSAVFDSLTEETAAALAELGYAPDEDGTLLLRRVLHADGRSTIRIGGQPITATLAREIGRYLLNIHGQNDNQRLLQKSTHLHLLDAMGDFADEKRAYAAAYGRLCDCERELAALGQSDAEKLRLREMLEYQIKDIEAVKLKAGEIDSLNRERERLRNIEKIEKHVKFASQVLDSREKSASVAYLLGRGSASLRQIADVIPEAADMAEQLDDMMYRVRDMAEEVRAWSDDDAGDPTARLDAIEGRLDQISRLQRKYGKTEEEILSFLARAKADMEGLDTAGERFAALERQRSALREECRLLAGALTERRRAVAEEITERIRSELAYLDMPKVRFAVSIRKTEDFTATGQDDVEFLIATNPGEPLLPMIKIASGGELSRLMLALKTVLNDRDGVGCVVFDEVDTGISGKTSRKVGIRLCQMGRNVQVICITHAAQIASLADTHLLIEKNEIDGRMETSICPLDDEDRVDEIARILGGIEVTETQRTAAREMIAERNSIH
ncbi:MAG: DNA repair protein RecN [Ruminococcaceae bacterium]|nr:DNA repair protein RecN [Oscillospiraceae bacterium]